MISDENLAQLRAMIEAILDERGFPKLPSPAAQRQKRYRERHNCGAILADADTGGDADGKFYVYVLIDPRDEKAFYVGKGSSTRAFAHVPRAIAGESGGRAERIRDIVGESLVPIIRIDSRWNEELDAYERERELIETTPDLLNISGVWMRYATKQKHNAAPGKVITKHNEPVNGHNATQVWTAYSSAYRERYHADPVRNAKVMGQVTQLCKRVGQDAAPMAAWYLGHGAARYVQAGHTMGLLLMDCEKLHTEWQTGHRVTSTAAAQSDRTQATGEVFGKLIEEVRRNGKLA